MEDKDTHERTVGTVGDTEIRVVAEGPKATWFADVLSEKLKPVLADIKAQLGSHG